MNIVEAMRDPHLFGSAFAPAASWRAWEAFLAALFGLPMTAEQLATYQRHAGRETPPAAPFSEAYAAVGRRGGKSRVAALVAVYLAAFRDYSAALAAGERGTVMVIAGDRRQARNVFRFVEGLIDSTPLLVGMVESRTQEELRLANRINIEVHVASFRRVRGYTVVAAILDELAFWPSDDAAEPDHEIVSALRPAMATVPGALLLGISSPYARRGVLWQSFDRYHGKDAADVLVWRASTREMNPSVPERVIARAYEQDPAAAAAEYGAQFRSDLEAFVRREVIDACTVPGVHELPPLGGLTYRAFVDPSGGSADSMTLAIAHGDGEGDMRRVVLDAVREVRPPFSPDTVVRDFAELLRAYRVREVVGDRYGGEWPRERFRAHGIDYRPSERVKSDLYRDVLPLLSAKRVELLDLPRLRTQLLALERRTARGGRDSIDHAPGTHDDLANAVAGAVHQVLGARRPLSPEEFYAALPAPQPAPTRVAVSWAGLTRWGGR